MIDEEILIQCFFKSPGECIIHCTGSKDTLYALDKVHITSSCILHRSITPRVTCHLRKLIEHHVT